MNLEFIHREVRQALARGTSQDENIPYKVEQAARWLERNNTMPHMERYAKARAEANEEGQLVHVRLSVERLKSIEFVRVADSEHYLNQIEPRELDRVGHGLPQGYWTASSGYLVLDTSCTELLELAYNEYTDWPKRPTATNWVIENAPDFLVAQAMLFFSIQLRDSTMNKFYKGQRDEALRTLLLAQEENSFSNRDMKMRFS